MPVPGPLAGPESRPEAGPIPDPGPVPGPEPLPDEHEPPPEPAPGDRTRTIYLAGTIPPEVWNRLGTKIIPRLKQGSGLKVGVEFSVTVDGGSAAGLVREFRQIIDDLGLAGKIRIEENNT